MGQGRLRQAVLALVLGAALACAGTARAGNSVAYQVDPAHDGFLADSLTPPLTAAWTHDFGDGSVSYPLVVQSRVYVTVASPDKTGSRLYALDAATGTVVWSRSVQGPGAHAWAAPAYDNGRIFVVAEESRLQAFDARTGAPLWALWPQTPWWHLVPPVAANGLVYATDSTSFGTLRALRESNGSTLWKRVLGLGVGSTPALGGGKVYLSYGGPRVFALSQSTGATSWSYAGTASGGSSTTPMLAGGRLWTWDSVQGHVIYDALLGTQLGGFDSWTAPAYADGVALTMEGPPYAGGILEARDGSTLSSRWSFQGDGTLVTPPLAVSNGTSTTVYVGGKSGSLYGLDLADGHVVWSTQLPFRILGDDESQMHPALAAGGRMLLVPAGGHLFAFRGAPPPNLLPNGSFEGSLDGWAGTGAALSLAADGKDGTGAGKAERSGPATTYGMIATPPPVSSTAAGTVYEAGGWVRSDRPGHRLCIGFRDWTPSGIVRTAPLCVTGTTSWQPLPTASYKAPRSGDKLDVYVVETNAALGDSFEADALSLTAG